MYEKDRFGRSKNVFDHRGRVTDEEGRVLPSRLYDYREVLHTGPNRSIQLQRISRRSYRISKWRGRVPIGENYRVEDLSMARDLAEAMADIEMNGREGLN